MSLPQVAHVSMSHLLSSWLLLMCSIIKILRVIEALAFRLHIKVAGNIHMTPNRKLKYILAVLSVLLLATAALARERKLSSELNQHLAKLNAAATPEIASQKAAEMVDVIIQFRNGAQLPSQLDKVKGIGGQHKNTFNIINGGLFRVPVSLLSMLAHDPDVTYISPDRQTIKLSPMTTSWIQRLPTRSSMRATPARVSALQ